jgi:hypothetical protein
MFDAWDVSYFAMAGGERRSSQLYFGFSLLFLAKLPNEVTDATINLAGRLTSEVGESLSKRQLLCKWSSAIHIASSLES